MKKNLHNEFDYAKHILCMMALKRKIILIKLLMEPDDYGE